MLSKKEMNVFKTLKENFNLSGRNREIYRNKLDNFIENYSTNFIYGIYGTTRENVKKLLEEVLEKGAEQTITDKGLDGRTKEARFIKEVDKKIKEANELSM